VVVVVVEWVWVLTKTILVLLVLLVVEQVKELLMLLVVYLILVLGQTDKVSGVEISQMVAMVGLDLVAVAQVVKDKMFLMRDNQLAALLVQVLLGR
jgi:hypothetical protein